MRPIHGTSTVKMKHFFLHYFGNPRTQLYEYVKYRISLLLLIIILLSIFSRSILSPRLDPSFFGLRI